MHISDSARERSSWNTTLAEVADHNNHDIESLILNLSQSIESYHDSRVQHKYDSFFSKTYDAYYRYISDSNENKINKFPQPSHSSLLQLVRFIPELPEKSLDVYLDAITGCFGVTIQTKSREKPILTLLMRENKEVIFSFVKRKNKIIKISGRAYFNDHLDDSDEIKNIIRMINL